MRNTLKITAAAFIIAATPSVAHALDVDAPYVEEGIAEIELKNRTDFDHRPSDDHFRQHVLGVGYGINRWWSAELEGEWEKDSGRGYSYNATEVENIFQFTETGQYWMDAGMKLAYEWSHEDGVADKVEAFALLAKQYTQFTHVANIGIEQEVGDHKNNNPELAVKWMSRYNYMRELSPGFEYYGDFGEFSHMPDYGDQKHRFGPVLYGKFGSGFKYELGWLFGISKAAEDHAVKLNVEYEFPL